MSSGRDRPPYPPDALIGSKYQLQAVLGEGGMSVVYDAVDITCDRRVAVKVIRPGYAEARGYSKERMRREAEVLVRLHEKTESVVDVLTAGITEDEKRLPFYVMERLRGDTLRQSIYDQTERGVGFTIEEVAGIGIPIATSLAHAHALGIVHRDTKPENAFMAVMRDGSVVVKVLDFGICAGEGDSFAPGTFTGTLPYAAPEQLEGRAPSPATDVYALGLVLFELLTLNLPHGRHRAGLSLERLAVAILKKPVPDLAALRSDAPRPLVDLVQHSLGWNSEERPTALDVAMVLRAVLEPRVGRGAPPARLFARAAPPGREEPVFFREAGAVGPPRNEGALPQVANPVGGVSRTAGSFRSVDPGLEGGAEAGRRARFVRSASMIAVGVCSMVGLAVGAPAGLRSLRARSLSPATHATTPEPAAPVAPAMTRGMPTAVATPSPRPARPPEETGEPAALVAPTATAAGSPRRVLKRTVAPALKSPSAHPPPASSASVDLDGFRGTLDSPAPTR